MTFNFILGVDMSKQWFHYALIDNNLVILAEGECDNNETAIFDLMQQICDTLQIDTLQDVLLCVEHTGIYIKNLLRCWASKGASSTVVHPAKVSHLLAGPMGFDHKNDQVDARRLAEYACRYSDRLKIWKPVRCTIQALAHLRSVRDRLIRCINMLQVPQNEAEAFETSEHFQLINQSQQVSLKALKQDFENVDQKIKELIKRDEQLSQLFKLVTSVKGVGPVTGTEIIIATEGFSRFDPNQAKAFANFIGVTPGQKSSGKSRKSKNRIPNRCHKNLKSLLFMGAKSLCNTKGDLGLYYERKMAEGKHFMSVINAMKNKIILRVFAVVRNQVMYQNKLNVS